MAQVLDREKLDDILDALHPASESRHDAQVTRADTARKRLADCDRRLARYRAALVNSLGTSQPGHVRSAPYRFGVPIEPPWFCDREAELDVLTARMRSGIHVFVLSPRRYGKTSLIRRAMDVVEADGARCAYANLLFATSETELATTILQAVVQDLLGRAGRARQSLETILRQLRITSKVSVGADGSVSLGLDASAVASSWLDVVHDAVGLLQRSAKKHPAVLVLDEFQVVATIGREGVGGAFKALADEVTNMGIVFSGSHLAVMEKLAKGAGAPLHGMGERLVLDVVPEEPMVAYLQRRARVAGKRLDKATGRLVYRSADAQRLRGATVARRAHTTSASVPAC